jgi:hypothetical protein
LQVSCGLARGKLAIQCRLLWIPVTIVHKVRFGESWCEDCMGRAEPPERRLLAGESACATIGAKTRAWVGQSRLKGGCWQDWLPHFYLSLHDFSQI